MMRRAIGVVVGAACALAMSPVANAAFHNYAPTTLGKPWSPGTTSFDWDEWSYADNRLQNNFNSNRTWTVPFVTDDAGVGTAHEVWAVIQMTPGKGNTTAQVISNYPAGGRFMSNSPVSAPTNGFAADLPLGSVSYVTGGNVYVNFVVGWGGGAVLRLQIDQPSSDTDQAQAPSAGQPWVPGESSFDWTNWAFADNSDGPLTNNAASARTWTIAVKTDDINAGFGTSCMTVVMANSPGGGTTTAEFISNHGTGARFSSIPPLAATNSTLTGYFLGSIAVPTWGTAYVNFVVAGNGGKLGRILFQY